MLEIILIGLNHKTAPVNVRECLAFSADQLSGGLNRLNALAVVKEVALISTCNRVEVLFTSPNPEAAIQRVKQTLADEKALALQDFEASLYLHRGDDAVRHLFRVAASLDSMMVGEPQILGQIKAAYRLAIGQHTTGVLLNKLFHRTFMISKRIRTETGIGDHAVSISYAAVELARKIFGELRGKQAMLIGAGEMAELAVENLLRHQVRQVYVANRTFERAVALAKGFNGRAVRFEEIQACLRQVDIIISSTGAPDFVIRREDVKGLMRERKNRPLFFIDIAVPRDIDPEINRLSNAYVYDIDDLQSIIEENREEREREAVRAERIVDEAVIAFRDWYDTLAVVPTIVDLRAKVEAIARAETQRTFQALKHLSENDKKAIDRMVEAMVNKIMHDPTLFLKNNGFHGDRSLYLDAVRKLFRLDD